MDYKKGRKLDLGSLYFMEGKKIIIGETCERICTVKLSKNHALGFNMIFLVEDITGFIITFEDVYEEKYKINIYEYIEEVESQSSQTHYKLWEILAMIDNEQINDTDIIKDNKDLEIVIEYIRNGNYDLKYLLTSSFTVNKKEYLTFYEARKSGIPSHKDLNKFLSKKLWSMNELVKEMEEKVWEVK